MYIILFDGVCNFCNSTINFIIERDKKNLFHFAPLQSVIGQELLKKHNLPITKSDSVVFIKDEKVYQRSGAALEITRYLDGGWKLFYAFKIVPAFIRDVFYNLIAVNRYKLFGTKEVCMIPTPEVKAKFLS